MKRNSLKQWLSIVACVVLIAAMALSMSGCGSEEAAQATTAAATTTADIPEETAAGASAVGEGSTVFYVSVADLEGSETVFEVHTDEETVGAALLKAGLLEGDMGEYGLYINVVNGVAADWDKDQTYWAFYIDGEYAMTGVDGTQINPSAEYSLVLTKG